MLETTYLIKTFVVSFDHILAPFGLLSILDINIIKSILDDAIWLGKKAFLSDVMWLGAILKKKLRKYLTVPVGMVYICVVTVCALMEAVL